MAELGAVQAAIGLIGNVVQLVNYLKEVKAAFETIKDDIQALIDEVLTLDKLYGSLKQECDRQQQQAAWDEPRQRLWTLLQQTLDNARSCFGKLEHEVKEVCGDPKDLKWRAKWQKQDRLRSRQLQLGRFRQQLSIFNQVLLLLQNNIFLSDNEVTRDFQRAASAQLNEIRVGIQEVHDRLDESEDQNLARDLTAPASFAQVSRAAVAEIKDSLDDAEVNEHFDIPQPVAPCYIGREDEAKILADCLLTTNSKQQQEQKRFVVVGVGGSGKTQFCCKFAEDHQQRFWGVFWVDGRSHKQLRQSLSQNVAKIGGVDPNHKAALSWLTRQKKRWLLIIDNADDPDVKLQEYFPKGQRGCVLVTTRNPNLRLMGNTGPEFFKFHGLRDDDASALLIRTAGLKASPEDVTPFAEKIVKVLGYLALAISVAGSAIFSGVSTIQTYLDYFEETWELRRKNKLRTTIQQADELTGEDGEVDVEATFDISYRAIEAKASQESRDALQLLKTFAFLHCDYVQLDFMRHCVSNAAADEERRRTEGQTAKSDPFTQHQSWAERVYALCIGLLSKLSSSDGNLPDVLRDGRRDRRFDETRFRGAMQHLTGYSLATWDERTKSWSMHPLVHRWAQEKMGSSVAEQQRWCEAAASLVSGCVNLGEDNEALMMQLMPHLIEVRKSQKRIEARIESERRAQWYPLPIFESNFSPQRMFMMARFSIIYARAGRFKEACKLQDTTQQFCERVLGFKRSETRRITAALAWTYWQLGRPDDSARLREKLVEVFTEFYGPDARETLVAKQQLGESRFLQGKVSQAKVLFEEAVVGLQKLNQPDDDDLLNSKDLLGCAMLIFGTEESVSKARSLHREAYEARKRLNGADDLKTTTCFERLCSAATWQSDREILLEADRDIVRVVEVRRKKLRADHAFTLLAMLTMARIKVELEEFDAAEKIFDEGYPVAAQNHGEDHMAVLFCRFHIGRMRVRQKRYAEARDILADVAARQKYNLQGRGRYHLDRIGVLVELATAHMELREFDEYDQVVEETLEAFRVSTTVEHPKAKKLKAEWAESKRQRALPVSP